MFVVMGGLLVSAANSSMLTNGLLVIFNFFPNRVNVSMFAERIYFANISP